MITGNSDPGPLNVMTGTGEEMMEMILEETGIIILVMAMATIIRTVGIGMKIHGLKGEMISKEMMTTGIGIQKDAGIFLIGIMAVIIIINLAITTIMEGLIAVMYLTEEMISKEIMTITIINLAMMKEE